MAPILIQVLSFVKCARIGPSQSIAPLYGEVHASGQLCPLHVTTHATTSYAMRPSIDRPVLPSPRPMFG